MSSDLKVLVADYVTADIACLGLGSRKTRDGVRQRTVAHYVRGSHLYATRPVLFAIH